MAKTFWLFVFMFLFITQLTAQTVKNIKVNVFKTSLSKVLQSLKENYDIQFAFDNDMLSKYVVSVNRTFRSEEEALTFLFKDLPFKLERAGDVFLIIPVLEDTVVIQPAKLTQITGQVLESKTYEPLPFSYVSINNKNIQTDHLGNFNFVASADSVFDLRISHLGYYIYDTIITQSVHNQFLLNPQIKQLAPVIVKGNLVENSTLIGDKPGEMKINHRIAPVLPGHGDNSVFNLLRLMPGILAAGEQSNDLLIWGGYESQSRIQFDGFTVFGLKNFNDNISVVNPFMVKDIEVMKGGYEARYGDRVGGIVDIIGKSGTMHKPSFTFNINTSTINSLLEVPLSERSSVIAAYRQTYYQLYDPTNLEIFRRNSSVQNGQGANFGNTIDFNVTPDYNFRDANLKYVYRGNSGSQFTVSLSGGGDKFDYNMTGSVLNTNIIRTEEERNRQLGSSVQYTQPWRNGNKTSLTATYSVFERLAEEQNKTENKRLNTSRITRNISSENNVDESTINAEHRISFVNGHQLIVSAGAINNNVSLSRKSFLEQVIDLNSQSPRIYTYVQDELPVGEILELKSGVRFTYSSKLNKWYIEPRVSSSVRLTKELKFNASWGLYNQFMSKTSIVDSLQNFAWFWTNSDDENIPVLHAQHLVGGLSYFKNGFCVSAEVYYKTTEGLTRFYNGSKRFPQDFYTGDARTKGLDVFIKKEYKRNMAWVSYTLNKTEEHYPFYGLNVYKPAPQNQTHEFKVAGIVHINSLYISTNFVYGSGFERFDFENRENVDLGKSYSRWDAALVYQFRPGKINAELGLSVLNMLNRDNIKYSNLKNATVDDINLVGIYVEAVPFTPALFLKIAL